MNAQNSRDGSESESRRSPLQPLHPIAKSVDSDRAEGVRVALHELTACPGDLAEQVAALRTVQWQGVGLLRSTVWRQGDERVAELMADHQVAVSSLSWAGGFTGTAGFTFREAIQDGRSAIREAALIGADSLVIVPGRRGNHTFRHSRRIVADGIKFLLDDAVAAGVRLAIQVAPFPVTSLSATSGQGAGSCVEGLDAALQLISSLSSQQLGLACPVDCWDGQEGALNHLSTCSRQVFVAITRCPGRGNPVPASGDVWQSSRRVLERLVASGFQGFWELQGIGLQRGVKSVPEVLSVYGEEVRSILLGLARIPAPWSGGRAGRW